MKRDQGDRREGKGKGKNDSKATMCKSIYVKAIYVKLYIHVSI